MINYYLITKPGIVLGNLITVGAGFFLASKGILYFWLFLTALLGMGLMMASACICNNFIDRKLDQKMERTKTRPLAAGLISAKNALSLACVLFLLGVLVLLLFTNLLSALVASFGFFVYVVPYSLWKSRTIYGTAIGSIAGAVPPVVGYTAVSNQLDAGALILFAMLVLWQMPHFFAIALYHFDDYVAANIPALPIAKGVFRTKLHMALYIALFIPVAALLTYFNYTGYMYLFVTLAFSLLWLYLCLKGFTEQDDKLFGKNMFRLSLIVITALCLAIPFNSL